MSPFPGKALDPKYAPERVDALASCSAALQQWASIYTVFPVFASLEAEQTWLLDAFMIYTPAEVRGLLSRVESNMAAAGLDSKNLATHRAARCVYQRRLAQLEGSPLISGAVDGTLTPLSIGGQTPSRTQQGKDARIIASDGRSAMDCVFLQNLANGDSGLSGGGRVLVNRCTDEVEIGWCYSPGDCDTETGSGWTVQPGKSWPVKAEGGVRWAACHGRDTAGFVEGSYGLRYYCKAPAKK